MVGFGRLLASYTVNELGDAVGIVALAVLVFDETQSALATTALFLCLKFVPALLAPAVTARLDQASLRASLPALYALEAAVFVALALQVEQFALAAVLILGLFDGVIALTGRGLSRGAVATLLAPHDQLRDGNALLNIAFGLASVAGLAAGGILVSAASLETALLVDAASFGLIAMLLVTSRHLPTGVPHEARQRFRARLAEGLAHVRNRPEVKRLLGWQFLALLLFTIVLPIEVVYAKETLAAGDAGFGLLLATWSAGILIGSLVYARVRDADALRLVLTSTAAIGAAYVGMGIVDELWAACAFSLLGGIGNGVQWVSVMTLLQESTPADLQARMAGLLESAAAAAPGLGFVLGGVLTALLSPAAAFLAAGGGLLLLVLAGYTSTTTGSTIGRRLRRS